MFGNCLDGFQWLIYFSNIENRIFCAQRDPIPEGDMQFNNILQHIHYKQGINSLKIIYLFGKNFVFNQNS